MGKCYDFVVIYVSEVIIVFVVMMVCRSPRKCSSMIEDVDGGNVQGELCSSWTRKKGRFSRGDDGRNSPNLIDLSRSQDFSLEGLAGNTSSSMLEENG